MDLQLSSPERERDVRAWLAAPEQGETVKEGRGRSVHRWNGLFIKRYRNPGLAGWFRGLFADAALRQYRASRILRDRGFDVPAPVAWARDGRETCFFAEEIPGARSLFDAPPPRETWSRLGGLLRRLHDAGVRNSDFHLGNVLAAGGRLWLVDLQEVSFGPPLAPAERAAALGFAAVGVDAVASRTDVFRFLRGAEADPAEVLPEFRHAAYRRWTHRTDRPPGVERADGLLVRRPASAAELRRALDAAPLRVVKETPRRRLWLADASTFVKEGAPAAWRNAAGLEARRIPTPPLLGTDGARVAGRWLEGAVPLADHVKARGGRLEPLARLVRTMHERGVFHRDLKGGNVLARDGAFWIADVDRVDFLRELPWDSRALNLAQLNASVGAPATRSDRLRFWFAYAGWNRALRSDWKRRVREVMRLTIARRHVWP